MTHVDSGGRCCVSHFDKDFKLLPGCTFCPRCRMWIRPERMDEECPSLNDFHQTAPVGAHAIVTEPIRDA